MNLKVISASAGLILILASLFTPLTRSVAADGSAIIVVTGDITSSVTWTSTNTYLLNGAVFVKEPAILTIQPGTTIKGLDRSFLVIERGAKLMAEGTPAAPIVFTSSQEPGFRSPRDWGGLWINGRAPINTPGGQELGETGITGTYGGGADPDPHDNSGIIRYVRIEFAGFPVAPDAEINNFTLAGVGDGTRVDHIHVNRGADDGIEFFGGTVNVKYILATGTGDDGFDWQIGYVGKVQFVVIQADNTVDPASDRGIEADNNENNNNLLPVSDPQLYNFTIVGDKGPGGGTAGIVLRRGTAGDLRNFIVVNYKGAGIDIQGGVAQARAGSGELTITNSIFFNNNPNFQAGVSDLMLSQVATILRSDPLLRDPRNLTAPDFRPLEGSPALDASNVAVPPADGFFTPVAFMGGVDPQNDWTQAAWISVVRN
ncbi:MAG: hypothetical protein HY650_03325 [Acidobacteria bacterium]|nr:hypothetical protein [Acidobacteriota bacterium]